MAYSSHAYAQSLAHWGTAWRLPAAGTSLIERAIPGTGRFDAAGPYPLLACEDWTALAGEFAAPVRPWVSLTAVADPFGEWTPEVLQAAFPDLARPYKAHAVADLSRPLDSFVSAHHRRNARAALQRVEVEACADPARWSDDWERLYAELVARHGITGVAAFPRESQARQLALPEAMLVRAEAEGRTVGMLLWLLRGEVASYHLGAYSPDGYRLKCSFALFWRSLELLSQRGLRWAHLGAGAGGEARDGDGLARFKHGWASGERQAWLCGRILDREDYAQLCSATRAPSSGWFPAYRASETA